MNKIYVIEYYDSNKIAWRTHSGHTARKIRDHEILLVKIQNPETRFRPKTYFAYPPPHARRRS
jgi:hypothetical protein